MVFWPIGWAWSANHGKPPPESFAQIRACRSMEWFKKTWQGIKTLLITDGAPAYPKVARERQIDHDCVNHSKGQFAKWIKRRQQRINSNTGMIDQCWKELKQHTKWIDHTKSVAVSVRTLLAVALHQYVQRHFEDYSKNCTASVAWLDRPNFDWQARENDSQVLVAASVLDLQKHDQKKNSMELPRKRAKKRLKCAETSRLIHFVSQRLFTNVNASTRGFQSGGIFLIYNCTYICIYIYVYIYIYTYTEFYDVKLYIFLYICIHAYIYDV